MVYNFNDEQVKTSFDNIAEFMELTERAKDLSTKFEGAEYIQEIIESATFEMCDDKIFVDIDIMSIFFMLKDLLFLPKITNLTLEYYGLMHFIFRGLEFADGFYFSR